MRQDCNILCKKMILQIANYSFNPNLVGLFRGSFWGGRGLEMWYVSTHTFNSRKYTFSTKNTLIFLISAFFLQKIIIFGKNSTYTQSNSMTAVLLLMKMFHEWCVWNPASGLLQIRHNSKKLQWRHNLPTWRHCYLFDVALFP